jgi:hypothetical protein
VGKQVNEREEVIEDKLRRKDVDVQKLGAKTTRTRRCVGRAGPPGGVPRS